MKHLNGLKEYFEKQYLKGKTFEHLYNLGVDSFGKQNYDNAIKFFSHALAHKDVKPQAFYNLGLTYQCMKDYDKAIIAYHKFLIFCPKDYDGLYNLALVYYTKQNYQKAIEFFERCHAIQKDEDGVKSLILALLNGEQIQKAIDIAEDLLNVEKNGIDLYYIAAKAFENKNSMNKEFTYLNLAIDMYRKIIDRDPQYFKAYLSISVCFAKKGEWENSVDFCRKALDTNPKSYEANNQMGLVYYCCDEIKEAVKYYEAALKLKPDGDYKIYSNLGFAYEKIGQYDKAVKVFSQLVSKFSQCPVKDEIKNHLRVLKTL